MTQTVLQIVQEFCGEKSLPIPSSVVGNIETSVTQIRYLLQKAVRELAEEGNWQQQIVRTTITATGTAGGDQGLLSDIGGFSSLIPNTMWNATQSVPIFGPVGDPRWQLYQSHNFTGPAYQYRIEGGRLYILPVITAGDDITFYINSSYSVLPAGGGAAQDYSTLTDDSTFLLPETLVHKSLDYRWKRVKGEPWENDYNEFLDAKAGERASVAPELRMDSHLTGKMMPGIIVPAGSWTV